MTPLRPLLTSLVTLATLAAAGHAQKTTRILGPGGVEPNGHLSDSFVSESGSTIVFSSGADNLIPNDANAGTNDVFAYDVESQTIELISRSTSGQQSNGYSGQPSCSADGRYVVYWSFGSNLDPADTVSDRDVFLFDRVTEVTTLVDPGSSAAQSRYPYISPNGEWIAFISNGAFDPQDTNGVEDVYVHKVTTSSFLLASVDENGDPTSLGAAGPVTITNDGKLVSFQTEARLIAEDKDDEDDVYVHNLASGALVRPGKGPAGSSNGFLSADGTHLAFSSIGDGFGPSDANGMVDVYLWDLDKEYELVSAGAMTGPSFFPRVSHDASFVVFQSNASDLVPGDTNGSTDTFLYELGSGDVWRVDVATDGSEANAGTTGYASVTADGETVVYASSATNLVPNDTTTNTETMITTIDTDPVTYCTAKVNSQGCAPSIDATGAASVSVASELHLTAVNVLNEKNGLFFYGTQGAAALPFQGGTLCVMPPLRRTPAQNSFGNTGMVDCSGQYDLTFTPWLTGLDPNLVIGVEVCAQAWMRDPQNSGGIALTNGVRFVVCP